VDGRNKGKIFAMKVLKKVRVCVVFIGSSFMLCNLFNNNLSLTVKLELLVEFFVILSFCVLILFCSSLHVIKVVLSIFWR